MKETKPSFKVVVLGDSGVGKTCVLNRIAYSTFSDKTSSTIGTAYIEHTINTQNGPIRLNLFDTAGQERYRSITRYSYKDTDVALVFFDVTNKESFEKLDDWIADLKQNAPETAKFYIVGNKIDMFDKQVISDEDAYNYGKEQNMAVKLVSAKDGSGIKELLDDMVESLNKKGSDSNPDVKLLVI